ncbi:MAG TPA: hypothetical protein VMW56_12475 [Candidatus Margulisiibacteriota bacterium]|nr:hypothetical protein [Candidatus Margulisiibacteriota bacterium]
MAHFEATVRIFEINESNASAARRVIEERLRAAGFSRWQIARVVHQGSLTRRVETARRVMRTDVSYIGGSMLIAAMVAWTLWFLWLLAS